MENQPIPATSKWSTRALLAAFLLALAAPWIDTLVRDDDARSPREPELRGAERKPELKWDGRALWKYPGQYEKYFQDSFGLRDKFLRWHSLQTLSVFDTSPSPLVFLGRDDWMFYYGNQTVPVYRGLEPFSQTGPDRLEAFVAGVKARKDWLAGIGCEHLLVIAPNKESVYPEYMPGFWTRLGPTRLDQFMEAVRRDGSLNVIDLRPVFEAAKSQDKPGDHIYFEEGTHWNGRGSLIAYNEIMREAGRLLGGIGPKPAGAFEVKQTKGFTDTWRRSMYALDTSRQTEVIYALKTEERKARVIQESAWGTNRVCRSEVGDPKLPSALFLHDSFGPYIEEPLREHFREMCAVWDYRFPGETLLEMRPSIMIEMWVERALVFLPAESLSPANYSDLSEDFARARNVYWRLSGSSNDTEYQCLPGLTTKRVSTPSGWVIDMELQNLAGSILLPPIPAGQRKQLLLELQIDSPVDTVADLFWLKPGMTEYARSQMLQFKIKQGSNRRVLLIPDSDALGRLRLRPGFIPEQRYSLRSAEVRVN